MEKPKPLYTLKNATFDELVKNICEATSTENSPHAIFIHDLLQLLPRYTTRHYMFSVLKKLLAHPNTIVGAITILKEWCMHFFHRDFGDSFRGRLYQLLLDASKVAARNTMGSTQFLKECIGHLNRLKLVVIRKAKLPPVKQLRVVMKPSSKGITAHSAFKVAVHLTKLEHLLFTEIPVDDFAAYPEITSLKLKQFIDRFNNLTGWIITHITRRSTSPETVLKYFLKVARGCEALANYNAVFAITSCYSSPSLREILRSYPLNHKYRRRLSKLENTFDNLANFRTYRAIIRSHVEKYERRISSPFIPHIGIFLKDLTVIREANPNYVELADSKDRLINVAKIELLGAVLRIIKVAQSTTYDHLIPYIDRGLYDSLLSLDVSPSKNVNRLSLSIKNKKVLDSILRGADGSLDVSSPPALPAVCSSGTLSSSEGAPAVSNFMNFLASKDRDNSKK